MKKVGDDTARIINQGRAAGALLESFKGTGMSLEDIRGFAQAMQVAMNEYMKTAVDHPNSSVYGVTPGALEHGLEIMKSMDRGAVRELVSAAMKDFKL